MWADPIFDGIDTIIRIASWNATGNETTLLDVIVQVTAWFS
jgi:hypothetical protein